MMPSRNREPRASRRAPWSPRWLAVGLVSSLAFHLLGTFGLYAVPLPYMGSGAPALPTADAVVLAALGLVAASLAGFSVRASRAWERRYDGWVMASATATFAALSVGGHALHRCGWAGIAEGTALRGPLALALGLFGAGFALALVAVVVLSRRRTRGWMLAAFGLVIPPYWSWVVWHFLFFPMYVRAPSEAELALPEVAAVPAWFLGTRGPAPSLRLRADGAVLATETADAEHAVMLLDPAQPGDANALQSFLREAARNMRKRHLNPAERTGPMIPDEPLYVLADADVACERVLALLEACLEPDVRIWRIVFGVRRASRPWLGFLYYYLPRDGRLSYAPAPGSARVELPAQARWGDAAAMLTSFLELSDSGVDLPWISIARFDDGR
jgi:hypothetical protein